MKELSRMGLRLHIDTLQRAGALTIDLEKLDLEKLITDHPNPQVFGYVTAAGVLRLAIFEGLAVLERKYSKT